MPDDAADPDLRERIARGLAGLVPHNRALGLRLAELGPGTVTMVLPYAAELVGNPATGVLAGGAITALLDATCGSSVFAKLAVRMPIATLDLRIDYLRPARPGLDVHASAECFKVARHVAFVRARAFHPGAEDDLVAVANGTFMLFRDKAFGDKAR